MHFMLVSAKTLSDRDTHSFTLVTTLSLTRMPTLLVHHLSYHGATHFLVSKVAEQSYSEKAEQILTEQDPKDSS